MAKWLNLEPDKLVYQPDQQAFLAARRQRWCHKCKKIYVAKPPFALCEDCGTKGSRLFNHLTTIAGRRFGKSLCGSIAGTEEASINNTVGWACAPTNPKLHRYVIPAFQKLIPEDWIENWNAEYLDLRLRNGSLIHFQTLEHPDQGRGQGLDWLWIDEVSELTEDHWNVINPSLGDRQGVAFFTTSPRGYDWVYERLYKPAVDNIPGFWGLHARSADGPAFQTDEGRAFLAQQKQLMPDLMYRQEFEADFVTFTGAVYGTLLDPQIIRSEDKIKHLIPEWPAINADRPITIGIDTGADHPFGAVKLVSTENGLVAIGEYLERDKSFVEHAPNLLRLAAGSDSVRWGINKNERQAMLELAQHKIYPQKSENNQVAGIERVKTWLHSNQLWFYEPMVPKTVMQMKALRWSDNTTKDGQSKKEQVYKKNDELPDCVRYAVMTWPILPKIKVEETKERDISKLPDDMKWVIERVRRTEKFKEEPDSVVGDFWL